MDVVEQELAVAIGKAIASRRKKAGMGQDEVAERLGIGDEAVSRMERGKTIPTVLRLAQLADIFGCRLEELISEVSNRPSDQVEQIESMLRNLPIKDREAVLESIRILTTRMSIHKK